MALNISNKYPGRSNPPSIDYPEGSIKNQTAPGAKDGTPLDADWANDKEGFFQKALSYRGVTANGTPDTAISSQYFDALYSDPTETLRGMPMVATQVETNAGTNDAKAVTPKKLRAGFSALWSSNGYIAFPTWLGGLIFQWGRANVESGGTVIFPIQFTTDVFAILPMHGPAANGPAATGVGTITASSFIVYSSLSVSAGFMFVAIGR